LLRQGSLDFEFPKPWIMSDDGFSILRELHIKLEAIATVRQSAVKCSHGVFRDRLQSAAAAVAQ
jgi:hypothetical protein